MNLTEGNIETNPRSHGTEGYVSIWTEVERTEPPLVGGCKPPVLRGGVESDPLVTYRNNFDIEQEEGVFRFPRPYVRACGKGTLATFHEGGVVKFRFLPCGSWSCPTCRKKLAAKTLDSLRLGMESRAVNRIFLTTTIDPSLFGAFVVGRSLQEDGRWTNIWSEPSRKQFDQAVTAMSSSWKKLLDRLNRKAAWAGVQKFGYFRVIELHRSGWPHYHVVLEHPSYTAQDLLRQCEGWELGRIDVRDISLEDAVGEVAPYLVCSERKGNGTKSYQFAASSLPKNFRLYSKSKGFFLDNAEREVVKPQHATILKGHFTTHQKALKDWGSSPMFALNSPSKEHRPPSTVVDSGDIAVIYYSQMVSEPNMLMPPSWLKSTGGLFIEYRVEEKNQRTQAKCPGAPSNWCDAILAPPVKPGSP
jgi:hypothetical protein